MSKQQFSTDFAKKVSQAMKKVEKKRIKSDSTETVSVRDGLFELGYSYNQVAKYDTNDIKALQKTIAFLNPINEFEAKKEYYENCLYTISTTIEQYILDNYNIDESDISVDFNLQNATLTFPIHSLSKFLKENNLNCKLQDKTKSFNAIDGLDGREVVFEFSKSNSYDGIYNNCDFEISDGIRDFDFEKPTNTDSNRREIIGKELVLCGKSKKKRKSSNGNGHCNYKGILRNLYNKDIIQNYEISEDKKTMSFDFEDNSYVISFVKSLTTKAIIYITGFDRHLNKVENHTNKKYEEAYYSCLKGEVIISAGNNVLSVAN